MMPSALERIRAWSALLFGFRQAVPRRTYLRVGLLLFALKYSVDLALTAAFAAHPLNPLAYANPLLSQRLAAIQPYPAWLPMLLLVWALPFIWVGVSMSARRAVHAGQQPWLSLLFFVPILNYLLIALLCAAPQRPRHPALTGSPNAPPGSAEAENSAESALARLRMAALSVIVAAGFGAFAAVFSVFGATGYGLGLFVGAPFVLGVIAGFLFNRSVRHSESATIAVSALSVSLAGGMLLLLSLEGLMCLTMAAGLAYPLAIMGALLGRALARGQQPSGSALSMVVAWPLLTAIPWDAAEPFPVTAIQSSVEINAPPERVWPNVIGFSPLPPPSEWLMQIGVACPLSARIVGEGVGAVRYCEFTTGAFVEPITAWDPPYRLAFDVTAQPPSMREWSPYEIVHAPHLHNGIQSLRGEFKLTRLPGNRTRLEGTTWYRLNMAPHLYWSLYSDYAIHVIHHRVLSHIGGLSEARP
ncbi:MAG TPA: SRPBCC family protein [Polyangiaceae bacterium]|nr:SRPBCC family protein [Polyangiaceae bacterium]